MNRVQAGRTFDFDFDLDGEGADSFAVTMDVLQYPGDTPTVSRALTLSAGKYLGALSGAETTTLRAAQDGSNEQWFIHINAVDSDEDLADPVKLYVSKKWSR